MSARPGGPETCGPGTRPRRLVLTGGGTGGHLYPAISLAREIVKDAPGAADGRRNHGPVTPVFIGTHAGLEAGVVPREGFEFHAVISRKLTRSLSPGAALSMAAIAVGTLQAGLLLRRLKPIAVVGTGGYASAGVVLAAALQRIPTLIHEQNSIPGRTNRLLARIVRRVALTFPEAATYFPPGKTIVTGLPVRPEIALGERERGAERFGLQPERRTLLVLGGSRGARSLNLAVREALALWSNSGLQIIHQVGGRNWEEQRAALSAAPAWYHPVPYLEEMGDAYAAADLVICRAGASTLAEVSLVGRPAILVPYPYSHADHQAENARTVVSAGAAVLVRDDELSGSRLAAEVAGLLGEPARLTAMARASQSLGRPDAARAILDAVWEMIDRPGSASHTEHGLKRGAA